MLNKNQSNKRNSWKYAVVLPLLGAFLFFFQVKVVAQEKTPPKQETETKSESVDLTKFKVEKDLNTLSKGKEIYINGEKSSQEELDKLNPNEIKNLDVIKKSNNTTILVTTKSNTNYYVAKSAKLTDKEIFINGSKASQEELDKLDPNEIESVDVIKKSDKGIVRIVTKKLSKTLNDNDIYINGEKADKNELLLLDQNTIDKMDVNKNEKTIRITTKTITQSSDAIDLPTPPTPPTPPAYKLKNPKPPVFPKAPKAPKGDPIHGDKKAWKEYESQMEEFNKKMEAMEPEMKAFDKKMEEFDKQMKPFNAEMDAFDKKMKIYEQQMEEYQSKLNAKKGK